MPHKQMAALNKELSDLQPVVEGIETLQAVEDEIRGLEDILADLDEDKEMKAMAREDLPELRAKVEDVEKDLLVLLIPKDEVDNRDIILEVRAGAGGDEAAVFALDLFKMYEQYCKTQGWRFEVVDCEVFSMGGGKGTREASATVTGQAVYGYLKFESGVHRVQRVPVTEGAGRVHTSAASVAVLPQAEEVDVEVRDADLRIDTMRSSGAGGQHVNCTDSAVRITHLPSGVVVTCQDQRSQHKNKDKALKVLRARLFDFERQKAAKSRAAARKSQIGSGDRSERIRTYNFPQGRITDHRVNITQHGMEAMMSGVLLNDFIDELAIAERSEYLASLGGE